MRTPLSFLEWTEREHERLLARRGLQAVQPLFRRLIAESTALLEFASEIARIGEDRAVLLPVYRTAAQERALLVRVLDALAALVPFDAREDAALDAFLEIVNAWSEPTN